MGAAAKTAGKANDSIGERIAEKYNKVVTTRLLRHIIVKVARWQALQQRRQWSLARVRGWHQRSVVTQWISGLNNKYPSPAQAVRIQLCGVRVWLAQWKHTGV